MVALHNYGTIAGITAHSPTPTVQSTPNHFTDLLGDLVPHLVHLLVCHHHNSANHLSTTSTVYMHQRHHSQMLRPFILLPDHVLGLLGDFILHLVHLKVSPTYQPNNLLKGVGARDVHADKKQCLV